MHIDLDQIRATAPAWDFSFTASGITYRTKPWTLQHSVRLGAAAGEGDLRALLADMIQGDPPWQHPGGGEWDEQRLADVIAAIVAYRQELGRKNSERIVAAVAGAMRTRGEAPGGAAAGASS